MWKGDGCLHIYEYRSRAAQPAFGAISLLYLEVLCILAFQLSEASIRRPFKSWTSISDRKETKLASTALFYD
jgi:hypothetical protein